MTEATDSVQTPERRLGERIRTVRQARRLSLRALASATRTSPGFLSELERGQANASIATLRKIADGLGLTLPDLFSEQSLQAHKVLRREDRVEIHASDLTVKYLITQPPLLNLEVYIGELAAGGRAGEPYSHGTAQEILFVNKGQVTLVLDGEEYLLKAGDSAEYQTSLLHTVRNHSNNQAEVMWIISPPTSADIQDNGNHPASLRQRREKA